MTENLQWYEGLEKLLPHQKPKLQSEPAKKDPAPLLPSEIDKDKTKDDKTVNTQYTTLVSSSNSQKRLPAYLKQASNPDANAQLQIKEANPLFNNALREFMFLSGCSVGFIAFLYTNLFKKIYNFVPLISLATYLFSSLFFMQLFHSGWKLATIPPTIASQPAKPTPSTGQTAPEQPKENIQTTLKLFLDIFYSSFSGLFKFWNASTNSTTTTPTATASTVPAPNAAPFSFQPPAYRPLVSQPTMYPANQNVPVLNFNAPALSTFRPAVPASVSTPSHPKYHPAPLPTSHKESQYQDQLIAGMSYLDPNATITEFKLQDSQYQLIQQLRHWISKQLLKSLVQAIQGIDQFLVDQQLPHLTLLSASLPLEEMVAIFDTQPIATNFPTSLRELYKMFPTHPTVQGRLQLERYLNLGEYDCRDYMIHRIYKLSEGDFMTHYRWNSGGDVNDHWTHEYPTDNELIIHLFSTYIDLNCSHQGSGWLTNRTFSKEVKLGWNRRPHDLEGLFIKELEPNHLKYGVIDKNRLLDLPEGRFNLFLTLIVYLIQVRDQLQGRIGLFNANSNTYKLLDVLKLES